MFMTAYQISTPATINPQNQTPVHEAGRTAAATLTGLATVDEGATAEIV